MKNRIKHDAHAGKKRGFRHAGTLTGRVLAVLTVVMLCFSAASSASATTPPQGWHTCFAWSSGRCCAQRNNAPNPSYRFRRRLSGGINGRHYYRGTLSTGSTLNNPNRAGALSDAIEDWNWVLSSRNPNPRFDRKGVTFNFTRTNTETSAQIRGWQGSWDGNWTGIADFMDDTTAGNHRYVNIFYNLRWRVSGNTHAAYMLNLRRVFNHEIGHALGLAHSNGDRHLMINMTDGRAALLNTNGGDRGILMNPFWDIKTAVVPTRNDVAGVIDIYCANCQAGNCNNPQRGLI